MDELSEMQKEWRAIVLDKLTSVEQTQKEIKAEIVSIQTTFAKQSEINELREKVDKLENFKYKLVGIFLGAQGVIAAIIWFIEHKGP